MKKLFYLFTILFAVLFAACEGTEPPTSNKVETGASENITKTSATLKGAVNVEIADYNSVEFGVMYDTLLAEVNNRSAQMVKGSVLMGKDFSIQLADLTENTKYYYCAYLLLNGMQYEFGAVKEFVTLSSSDKPEDPSTPGSSSFIAKPFSVSATKTVTFSPGNLQYHAANDEWRFAPSQLDYIGEANENISSTYNGWIDLFGWGTGNNPTNASTDYNDYQTFVDWGVNQIGSYASNTWRTLTEDEWEYIINERPNNQELIGVAQVNGVNGLILLPDGWTCPSGVTFKSGFHYDRDKWDYYAVYQTYGASEWTKLEASGAVFFPASGYRNCRGNVYNVGSYGFYWSSTPNGSDLAYDFYFNSGSVGMGYDGRCYGRSVRLVQDPDTPDMPKNPDTPEQPEDPSTPGSGTFVAKPFSVSATKTVTFSPGNLQYHPANDEWRFAPSQLDYVGADNAKISPSYNGWIDLFGWGTGNNPTNNSTDYEDYPTFVDWGVNKIGNDAPNTWRTLTYNEWDYILNNRSNASNLKGVAQVNGVNGLILLPDNWTCPSGVTFKSGFHEDNGTEYYAEYQTFSSSEWSKLEDSGAVFFPTTGYRDGSFVGYVQGLGCYWSATEYYSDYALDLDFISGSADFGGSHRRRGNSVRLVQD